MKLKPSDPWDIQVSISGIGKTPDEAIRTLKECAKLCGSVGKVYHCFWRTKQDEVDTMRDRWMLLLLVFSIFAKGCSEGSFDVVTYGAREWAGLGVTALVCFLIYWLIGKLCHWQLDRVISKAFAKRQAKAQAEVQS